MSTKEFTAQEIADINKDFAIGNALTKWKFMQTPEYAHFCQMRPLYCGERMSDLLL